MPNTFSRRYAIATYQTLDVLEDHKSKSAALKAALCQAQTRGEDLLLLDFYARKHQINAWIVTRYGVVLELSRKIEDPEDDSPPPPPAKRRARRHYPC